MSWAEVKSPLLQRLETALSRCWLSLITCKIRSNRVLLSFCLTSLLSIHWPEVMSRKKIVNSMCHFLSTCMTSLSENIQTSFVTQGLLLLHNSTGKKKITAYFASYLNSKQMDQHCYIFTFTK